MSKISALADEIIESAKDYPQSDRYEVMEELSRMIASDEGLSAQEARDLRSALIGRGV